MSSFVSPPSVAAPNRSQSSELRSERVKMRGTFGAFRRPPVVGVSDDVAYKATINAKAARRAEKAWLRSLTASEKRTLNAYRVIS